MKKLLLILLLCLITTSASGQFQQKPMLGRQINRAHQLGDPVGLWLLNEGSGNKVFDLSGNGKDGTLIGAVNWQPGKFGSNLFFTGGDDDYVNCGVIGSAQAPCTISVWVYWTGSGTSYIFDHASPRFACYLSTNKIYFYHDGSVATNYTLPTNQWIHLVYTFSDTGYFNFYVNGVWKLGSDTNLTTSDLFTGNFLWGTQWGTAQSFDGLMDLPMIYDRVLSASEIALLYREPFCMFQQEDIAIMATAAAPPPSGGQVITIQMSMLLIIPALIFIKRRKWK